jgi:hypothetical protein
MTQEEDGGIMEESAGGSSQVETSWTAIDTTGISVSGLPPTVREAGPNQWLPARVASAPKRKGELKSEHCALTGIEH